ncbi:P-loop containing nucleoside triphosphate hydrolase protein [Sphaerosporella brunnea]|uniref:ATP-dependent RNA helicase n=1 Tax=Sphaerosporella brunnea TaxID=1250544 RepID=A0A5J5ES95_9PEZI|nr:P-loop containing nucleoside triphosphate hydrolase protein [Sphaerosporella brunnea]
MANDGMILNFDISGDAFAPASKPASAFRGRWTERLKAKRSQQHRQQKKVPNSGSSERSSNSRPLKKTTSSKTDSANHVPVGPRTRANPEPALKRKRADDHFHTKPPAGADGTFVSSLWTGNPEAAAITPETQTVENAEPQAPSNAPLSDGSSTFTTLGLSPILAFHLTVKLSLKAPTAIQRSAIPELIAGDSDAFIQAETGSGKTLTYLLPIVDRIMRIDATSRKAGLFAIILAPTRELSRQIYNVLETLIHCKNGPHWIVPGQVTGGEKKKSEKARLRKGMNILVATPGRLLDHLENTKSLEVDKVRWLVLDEGDRLMELGFEEDIGKILDILNSRSKLENHAPSDDPMPKKRVTMLCSATMKTNVQKLGEISLKDATYIKAEKPDTDTEKTEDGGEKFTAPAQLRQSYLTIPAKLRLVGLNAVLQRAFIRSTAHPKVIVFFSCTDSVDFHYEVFTRKSPPTEEEKKISKKNPASKGEEKENKKTEAKPANAAATGIGHLLNSNPVIHKLHGSLPQPVRTATLASFTKCKTASVLFCTDVAARGLDLPNVDQVVQFDPPFSPDDHLHRIGRTARAGRDGRAVVFLLPGPEEGYVDAVLKKGIREGQLVRSDLEEVIRKGFGGDDKDKSAKKQREFEDKATEWHLRVERWVMDNPEIGQLAAKAWGSHIRAYTTHVSSEKAIFNHRGLHYGHLAKSFGLREKPTAIKVPNNEVGGGAAKGKAGKVGAAGAGKKRRLEAGDVGEVAGEEAIKKMRMMARAMEKKGGLSSEFNIG